MNKKREEAVFKQVREIRKQRGLTQVQLAQRIKNSQKLITRIENEEVDPRLSTLRKIAQGLKCELSVQLVSPEPHRMSLESIAEEKAREWVMMSVANSAIELQRPSEEVIEEEIHRVKSEMLLQHKDFLIKKVAEAEEEYGATPIDDLSGLKIPDIHTRKQLYDAEFRCVNRAAQKYYWKMLDHFFDLNYPLMIELHSDMFFDVWEWAGKIRNRDLSLGIKHHQIRPELQKLIEDFKGWTLRKWEPVEISVRLHHRLVWIHPFENGNGRWARLLTNL